MDPSRLLWKAPRTAVVGMPRNAYGSIGRRIGGWLAVLWLFAAVAPLAAAVELPADLRFPEGGGDALVITAPDGTVMAAANDTALLVPASIIKLLTALVALDSLGPDYRFPTDFAKTEDNRLLVRGYGDPLFISEVIDDAAKRIAEKYRSPGGRCLSGILIDAGYFADPLIIPGVSDTANPYDAPNGALCANFNTVFFRRNSATGKLESAEPQTPLLPFAAARVQSSPVAADRVVLSHRGDEATRYAGLLLKHFIQKHGCTVAGGVDRAPAPGSPAVTPWRFHAPFPLTAVIQRMMAYSNNFIANQILIAAAAEKTARRAP
jgi:D-alanyl-D-alanine carboxypeptidase/D-alanyl-D-alanine-endopeptidase (penicillin-binding protein 4)